MQGPSTPEPWSGSTPSSQTLGAGAPVGFFGNGHGATNETTELHWKVLDKFFEDNESTIMKAERSTMDLVDASDFGTTIDVLTDTVNVVLTGLTTLAQVHPALGVAIWAFHSIVSLDLTRRDNDKKVNAVRLQMQSMMCVMFQFRKLRHVHIAEEDRATQNSRLQRLIARITEEIKACGSDLNYYTERRKLSRIIGSKVYESRFAGHIATFNQRRSELQSFVTAYTAVGVDAANVGIAAIGEKMIIMDDKLNSILAMFQKLNSAREQDLLKFLEENGGSDKCINDDRLLNRLLAMAGESKKTPTVGSDGREEQQGLNSVRKDLKNDLKNLDTLLTQNFSRFEKLLEIQSNNLRIHMEGTNTKLDQIFANTMMIIDQGRLMEKPIGKTAVLTDPVLQAIWKSMGLKSTVKAKHFILTFRDHILDYMERTPLATPFGSPRPASDVDLPPPQAKNEERLSEIISNAGPTSNQIFKDELKDEWALKYLTVSYVHPIIEAMDEDCSGFISVKEANNFARARPAGRSLISWMAYWAIGWHRNLTQYKEEIYSTILQMHSLSETALPHNQQLIKSYLNGFKLMRVEALLRSIKSLAMDFDVETDALLHEYAASIASAQEQQLTQNLDGISYVLRSVNDVKLVVNHSKQRVETWILPVLYLVLKRHLDIVVLAQTKLLNPNEMLVHQESITFILNAFEERLSRLEAIFHQVYRGNIEAHFKNFAYGMFHVFFKGESYFNSDSILHREELQRHYKTADSVYQLLAKDPPDISILAEGPGTKFEFEYEDLFHDRDEPKKTEEEDSEGKCTEKDENILEHPDDDHPLDGLWIIGGVQVPFCARIKLVDQGKITGHASLIQAVGHITGDYKTEKGSPGGVLDFDLLMRDEEKGEQTLFFSGVYDPHREVIEGIWITKAVDPYDDFTHEEFTARRTPLELYHLRDILDGEAGSSSDAVDGAKLARRRWGFAIECIRSQTKARINSKSLTIARMKASRDLVKLHYESLGQGTSGDIQMSSYLQMFSLGLPNSATLLKLYRTMAKYRYERMLDDCGIRIYSCDNCWEHITSVRYQCITCTKERFENQIDLCHQCIDMDGVDSFIREANFVHRKSHSLLRSTPRSWIKMHELAWLIPAARLASEKVKAHFREWAAPDGNSSKMSDLSGGRGNRLIQASNCICCEKPILALPAWIRMINTSDDIDLICTDCAQNNSSADRGCTLLRVSDSARVWPSEAKSTRVEEDIRDMGSRINAVVDELSDLKNRMQTLESQVNNQLAEMLSMMKEFVLNRMT